MIAVAYYCWSLYLGYRWLLGSPLALQLTKGELYAGGIVVGTIGGAWLVYLIGCLFGTLSVGTVLLSTAVAIASITLRKSAIAAVSSLASFRFTRGDWCAWALAGALACYLFPIYSRRMIPEENGSTVTGGSCYGDLPIHMTIANSFLVGVNQRIAWGTMMSPIFAGEPMTYPFLPDFHAAIFVRLGGTLRQGFLWPGWMMATALWVLLFSFAARVTRSNLAGALAVLLTIGAGGMGGVRFWSAEGWDSAMRHDVIQHDPTGEWKYLWFAFIPHIMLPQRGGNFAYPMTMLCLLAVWVATDASRRMTAYHRASMLQHAALFAASLPMVQAHAFIGVGMIIGFVFLLDAHKWLTDGRLLLGWATAGVVALALAFPQMRLFTHTVSDGFYGKFMTYGWLFMNYPDFGTPHNIIGFFRFWWYSLGPALALFCVGAALTGAEVLQAWRVAQRLMKDNGTSAVGSCLTTVATAVDDTGSVHHVASQAAAATAAIAAANARSAVVGSTNTAAAAAAKLPPPTDEDEDDDEAAAVADADALGANADGVAAMRAAAAFRRRKRALARAAPSINADGTLVLEQEEPVLRVVAGAIERLHASVVEPLTDVLGLRAVARRANLAQHLDATARACNELTPTGRALDTLKFAVGAFSVFLLGNYINLQPWDRDNAKIFYVFIFVAAALVGGLLAAPFGYLAGGTVTKLRVQAWFSALTAPLARSSTPGAGAAAASGKGGKLSPAPVVAAAAVAAGGTAGTKADAFAATLGEVAARTVPRTSVEVPAARVFSLAGLLAAPVLLFLCTFSGWILLEQEWGGNGILIDGDSQRMGEWIRDNTPPGSVIMHSNYHMQPSSAIAGRPSLVAYYGWVSNHGYNSHERLRDRDYVMDNALKDEDDHAHFLCRRWGVKYVLGEGIKRHDRESERQFLEAQRRIQSGEPGVSVPEFDPNRYLKGHLVRIHTEGRFELFQVM